ncbi:hypothetical protein R1sor_020347 [Riccia sorocarpa]|uniref:DUF4283 domain-containing protein n=1 Tax=Riccia sorocarpa TaxID=122646 RepID=A0ABD3IIU1_9MARC
MLSAVEVLSWNKANNANQAVTTKTSDPSLKSEGPANVQPAAKSQASAQIVASPSRLRQQQYSVPGSSQNTVSQRKQESAGENAPAQRNGNAPNVRSIPKGRSNAGQDQAEQHESEREAETQFEPMGRRNPTWAEVTEQNIKKLDPFARFADIPLVDSVEREEVEEILDGLISNTVPVDNCEEIKDEDIIDIDARFLVSSTRNLQTTSIVVYSMDLKVSYKYVHQWAESVFHQMLGVRITSICSMSRNCFHICLESGTGRNHIFANDPFYMDEAMVYVLPWDPRFNPNELRTRSVPIWVELPGCPPKLCCIWPGNAVVSGGFNIRLKEH